MKALILANTGNIHFCGGEILPSCYLPLFNRMTVIERQISLLNVNGISDDEICALFCSCGIWELENVKARTERIPCRKIFTDKSEILPAGIFDSDFFSDDVLILEGNQVFDIAILSRLRRYRQKNVLVVRYLTDPDSVSKTLRLEGDKVSAASDSEMAAFPWVSFAGIARLSREAVNRLRSTVIHPMSLSEAINPLLNTAEISYIDYDDLLYGKLNGGHSDELIGGSYSKLNYRLVVKKEDDGPGRQKLINEINWLLNLPEELKPYFSEVLACDTENRKVFFDVPYYGSRNLREYIFDGHFDADSAVSFLEKLLDWMFEKVYSRRISDAPKDWTMNKHIIRVLDRLPEVSEKSIALRKIIQAERLIINGKEYTNIHELFTRLAGMDKLIKTLNPAELIMIHGDLHFQNILVYSENDKGFMLVDPRGELYGSDLYYDMGKLWHSFHGKYDFIHSDQFRLKLSWDGKTPIAEYELTNKFSVHIYDEIHTKFLRMITKYEAVNKDPLWEMKALFSEAAHFSSVSTFHVGKKATDERPIVLYLTGVILINEFFSKYICK